jgi:hypothetical protein
VRIAVKQGVPNRIITTDFVVAHISSPTDLFLLPLLHSFILLLFKYRFHINFLYSLPSIIRMIK